MGSQAAPCEAVQDREVWSVPRGGNLGDLFFLKAVQDRLGLASPLEQVVLENYSSMRLYRTGKV